MSDTTGPKDRANDRQHHRGRAFRGKRLKTTLPKPAVEVPVPAPKAAERIAKVMARAGLASRREAEVWIEAGRVIGQRRENHVAGAERQRDGQDHGGRPAVAAEGAHPAVSVS